MAVIERLRTLFGRPNVYVSFSPEETPVVEGMTARQLYATQANLHAVVSFLADSIAQLPLKVYRRNGETDRQRDRESPAALLLYRPNGDQTMYEFVNALAVEHYLMGVATVWVLPDPDSPSGRQLRLIPKEWIDSTDRATNYAPDRLRVVTGDGGHLEIPRTEFVQFRTYSPGNPGGYQSPIAALRQTLNEQIQADKFRTEVWSSSGRFNAYITRPKDVQPWTDEQKRAFVTAFREGWGRGGSNAGKMPLLEDGMEIKPYSFNAQQAQYAEAKQLSREDVAAAYHVNPSLIWHTSTQTYASAKDNARALYADCLGPTLQMIQQRINAFLLPMIGADPDTYVEFDLTEKLKGSFEERASILQSAVGGPWMTRNEARADNNMAPIEGGDQLITPLNVTEGGQASPQDTHMDPQEPMTTLSGCSCHKSAPETVRVKARSTKEEDEKMAEVLSRFWKRQRASVLPKIGAKSDADWWDDDRWNAELADDIEPVIRAVADAHGEETAKAIGAKWNAEQTRKYLRALSEGRAAAINASTRQKLSEAMEDEEDEENTPAHVFDVRENRDATTFGRSLAIGIAGWAATHEAPEQAEQQGIHKKVEKMWITGDNPRPEHAAMNGETVDIDAAFSNGCEWPGDEGGDPDTTCGCNCSTEVIITIE